MSLQLLVTLGPASYKEEVIRACDQHDIFVFRINLSHTTIDELEEKISFIRQYTDASICLDSEGAQIRNQLMKDGGIDYTTSDEVTIHFEEVLGDEKSISFSPSFVGSQLQVGDILNLDFNLVKLQVKEILANSCKAEVLSGGRVGSRKAADLNREIELPPITAKDEEAIKIGLRQGVKHFALSFAGCKEHVELFRKKTGDDAYIISKIESRLGVRNLREIIDATDAILIDRGDLSRQVPIEKIPFFQRIIISTAISQNSKVFVATNLLESMVKAKEPTRAEVNDIVSTILMGASGLVLAAETAMGDYPVECVEMVRKLTEQCGIWTPNTSLEELLVSL